jgi:hypothetical protein
VIALLLAALAARPAMAEVQRWAVIVGNNEGFVNSRALYFAEQDAKKVRSVLTSLGDVDEGDVRMLLGRNRSEILTTLAALRTPIAEAKARGDQTVLYFYYSGHGDADQLQLGRTWLTYPELEELLLRSGADVRVAFVDACQSGALTRTKGGTIAPPFDVDLSERLDTSGSYIITSSTGDEASQESDEIGGSYFTHFLASALTGAADADGDGRVTLLETYQHVFHETLYRTAGTQGGPQHATYGSNLSGTGDLVLTELDRTGAFLIFDAGNPGSFAVFDVERRMFLAEVDVGGGAAGDRRLSLRPGRYLVQRRYPTHLAVADVSLARGGSVRLGAPAFRALEYEADVAKGSVTRLIRQGNLPRVSVRTLLGARGFADEQVTLQYFPNTLAAGAESRFNWRDGKWASVDFVAGTGFGQLALPELPYGVPVQLNVVGVGIGGGYATREAPFRIGAGIHLQGIYLNRSFLGGDTAAQELFTIAPGLIAWTGWYPRRFELELALRTHYLPYVVDGRDQGMGYNELVLAIGYRF